MHSVFNGVRILIVDDEPDLREILYEDFSFYGATVSTAKNGREAYEIAMREQPHVILSDVRMPEGDGVELLQRVRIQFPTAPPVFILLTGFSALAPERASALGSQSLVSKPINLRVLRERVIEVLEKPA